MLALDESWIYKVSVLADRVARRVGAVVQQASGLNLSQWRVLAAVADKPGRTSAEVVRITPMDKAIVSRAVRVLIDEGLLRREASQNDGRRSYLRLTDNGWTVYERIVLALTASGVAGSSRMSDNKRVDFNAELDRLISAFD